MRMVEARISDIYAAFDTLAGGEWLLFTVSRDIEDQPNKVFLAADPIEVARILMDPKLRWTVTGAWLWCIIDCVAETCAGNRPLHILAHCRSQTLLCLYVSSRYLCTLDF